MSPAFDDLKSLSISKTFASLNHWKNNFRASADGDTFYFSNGIIVMTGTQEGSAIKAIETESFDSRIVHVIESKDGTHIGVCHNAGFPEESILMICGVQIRLDELEAIASFMRTRKDTTGSSDALQILSELAPWMSAGFDEVCPELRAIFEKGLEITGNCEGCVCFTKKSTNCRSCF